MEDVFFLKFVFSLVKLMKVFWEKDYSLVFVASLTCTKGTWATDLGCGMKMMFNITAYEKNKRKKKSKNIPLLS